jgi:hypothetical protein
MAEHEPCIGAHSNWLSPPELFAGLKRGGIDEFDLDAAHPDAGALCYVPCRRFYTQADNGLLLPWQINADRRTLVWLNPPFGGRNGHVVWLEKFLDHANGIAVVRAYTSSGWFHQHVVPRAELLLFPRGKTKFIRPDGSIGKAPGHGVVLIGMGEVACTALRKSGLGFCAVIVEPRERSQTPQPTSNFIGCDLTYRGDKPVPVLNEAHHV